MQISSRYRSNAESNDPIARLRSGRQQKKQKNTHFQEVRPNGDLGFSVGFTPV
jgi:hypothetical protein